MEQNEPEIIDNDVTGKALTAYDPVAHGLAELRQKYKGVAYDVTSTKGNAEARAARKELVMLRGKVDDAYKAWNGPMLSAQKAMRAKAAELEKEILALEKPIDEQIKADEERRKKEKEEKERVEREQLAAIERERLEAERLRIEAEQAAERERLAAERAEAERLAEIERQRLAAERAELMAKIEAERAKMEAERAEVERIAAAQRAEAEKLAEAERARVAAERAEMEATKKVMAEAMAAREARIDEFNRAEAARLAEQKRVEDAKRAAEEGQRVEAVSPKAYQAILVPLEAPSSYVEIAGKVSSFDGSEVFGQQKVAPTTPPAPDEVLALLRDVRGCLEAWDLEDRDIYKDVLSMMDRIKAAGS